MSDLHCIGVCVIDPDTGACVGCGRLPEEISGVPTAAVTCKIQALAPPAVPLPPQVAAQARNPTD